MERCTEAMCRIGSQQEGGWHKNIADRPDKGANGGTKSHPGFPFTTWVHSDCHVWPAELDCNLKRQAAIYALSKYF